MHNENIIVRSALPGESAAAGQLMIQVYASLEGFPGTGEQPAYYAMLANVGELAAKPGAELLLALSADGRIAGAVVYFGDMQYYGSGGSATREKASAGFRLLAVGPDFRGQGIGKKLVNACIDRARHAGLRQVIIHSTRSMQTAWDMYLRMGFLRSEDLDFLQGELPVFGFRLQLNRP
ncbi:GNAT family N-acetyltransferase [Chitinophaga rhizosphaerae]|uniref:GNAT family N-acetyltransferase n=1 Tax=Chitinophaga rhizosphaerae TaxID=1864947 RepID=UPI000F80C9E7|nr:GNAT family N-acetyltransferase [Chitinophaga rhizosphaerae]